MRYAANASGVSYPLVFPRGSLPLGPAPRFRHRGAVLIRSHYSRPRVGSMTYH